MATKANSKEVALEVKGVSKSFHLPTEQSNGIKQAFINWTKGVKGYKEQQVLRDISFTVEKGDFFGIVGRNGSGKSTLLKLISQIYTPDKGKIVVNGKLVPFIELGVGFNPELTGRENIYLNGALLGFSHEEMSAMYEDIVEFAELEEFMDQKLKNYSSGMQVRLAFSIAIKADADILVLDEVLAVGDEAFQRKCFNYFAELKRDKKTVVLVTHDMDSVQRFCNRAALIDKGHRLEVGNPSDIAQLYRELNDSGLKYSSSAKSEGKTITGNANIEISGSMSRDIKKKKLKFEVTLRSMVDIEDAIVTFVVSGASNGMLYRFTTDEKLPKNIDLKAGCVDELRIEIDDIFPDGMFEVQVGVKKRDRTINYILVNRLIEFEIVNQSPYPADVYWKPKEEYIYERK